VGGDKQVAEWVETSRWPSGWGRAGGQVGGDEQVAEWVEMSRWLSGWG